jgi:hypothetical protein
MLKRLAREMGVSPAPLAPDDHPIHEDHRHAEA